LSIYHAAGFLDKPAFDVGAISLGGGRFRYVLKVTDTFKPSEEGIGSLIVRLGLLAWEVLRRKPGILAIYDTVDARSTYMELAIGKIPPKSAEIIESRDIGALGDGKIFTFKDDRIDEKGNIIVTFQSDDYKVEVPVPKACRDAAYTFKGPLVYKNSVCTETDILLKDNKYNISETNNKLNAIEFLRGIQPHIFLGV
jgi:hypothetical protein